MRDLVIDDQFKLKYVQHSQLLNLQLEEIISNKILVWGYDYKSQYEWIKKNIKSKDFHVIMKFNNNFVGYLTIIDNPINEKQNIIGLGSIMIVPKFQGIGYSKILVNNILNKFNNSNIAIICKPSLIRYYEKFGFLYFNGTVLFNYKTIEDILMSTNPIGENNLELNRIF